MEISKSWTHLTCTNEYTLALGNKGVSAVGSGWLWGSFFSVRYSAPREEGKARLQGPRSQPGPESGFPAESRAPRGEKCPGAGRTAPVDAGSGGRCSGEEGMRRSVQAPVPSQPIGRAEKQDIVTRRGGESGGGGAGRQVPRTRGRRAGGGRRGASGARTRLSARSVGRAGLAVLTPLGRSPGAGFIFRFRRALGRWSGAGECAAITCLPRFPPPGRPPLR